MNSQLQTDTWIYHILVVLGVIVMASGIAAIALTFTGLRVLEIFVALGAVAVGGLVRLWISPMNWEL